MTEPKATTHFTEDDQLGCKLSGRQMESPIESYELIFTVVDDSHDVLYHSSRTAVVKYDQVASSLPALLGSKKYQVNAFI